MARKKLSLDLLVLPISLACLVSACGGSASSARAQREARAQERAGAQRNAAQAEASAAADDMVAAVGSASAQAPFSLRFRLTDRPVVGQPVHLQLALAPQANLEIDSIHISIQPREGLILQSDHTVDVEAPEAGQTQELAVQAQPTQAGVLGLSVTVLMDTNTSSLSWNYIIPLIAVDAAQ